MRGDNIDALIVNHYKPIECLFIMTSKQKKLEEEDSRLLF